MTGERSRTESTPWAACSASCFSADRLWEGVACGGGWVRRSWARAVAAGAGEGREPEGDRPERAGVGGRRRLAEGLGGVVQRHRRPSLEPLLQDLPVEVVAHDQEAPESELAEGAGVGDRGGKRRPVQVGQHGTRARVGAQALALLAGVFEGEEELLGDRAARPLEG